MESGTTINRGNENLFDDAVSSVSIVCGMPIISLMLFRHSTVPFSVLCLSFLWNSVEDKRIRELVTYKPMLS